ncbi:MAG TPA: 6-carboxytetrahydropterin synthase [Bryobacteraceae bacterium]|nr:6-carboxytetrahydropterin synthase [Bryobacteraceae bacterium]
MLITRRADFSASHSCYNPHLSEQQNRDFYGESSNSHGHGHNYVLEVTLQGDPDPVTGMIVDLKLVKEVIQRHVIEPLDHRHLNHEVPPFDRITPTTENVAREIWGRLNDKLRFPNARLHSVRLFETEDLSVEYMGD